ncbi:MAG: PQQ-binding-like beta-propeller repeat protein, partial [Planctomycetaceae bacterium]|nr:PQQ-binding-like beta-propeller repeat protein [Planctomycetaceae bacterium]
MIPRQAALLFRSRLGLLSLFVVGLGFGTTQGLAQFATPAFQKSAVVLDTNTEVVERLATVEDHVKERQWEQAILILQKVSADHGGALIAVSPQRYLNVTTYCNSILANFPPAGLAVYREKHDAQAKQWLEQGLASRDRALLEKVVQKAFVSRSGEEALFWLGEWEWDHGNFSAARDYWRKLLKLPNPPDAGQPQPVLRYPDSTRSQAEVVSRIVLCHLMEGNQKLTQNWLDYFKKQHPEARGRLAGKEGLLVEILEEVLQSSQGWNFPEPQDEIPTFAGNPKRDFRFPKAVEVGGVQWEIPLPHHGHDPASNRHVPPEPSLSYFPVIVDNTVFFCDPDRIYALDVLTGRAKWPLDGDGEIRTSEDLKLATLYTSPVLTDTRQKYYVGVPRFTLTIREDRLYARMGSPTTEQVSNTTTSNGHIVCLDLSKEGKLVWMCEPNAVLEGSKLDLQGRWAFDGTPIVEGGRVFVGLRQSRSRNQTEAVLACLDAETGKALWIHPIASTRSSVGEQQNFISHHLVTLGENMLFYMPEFGVVTALDTTTGRQLWAVTYPSLLPKESPILRDPRKQGLTPCVFHEGVLYAAPTDTDTIFAISAKTGLILWEWRIPFLHDQIRHVLGVFDNQLILTGNH